MSISQNETSQQFSNKTLLDIKNYKYSDAQKQLTQDIVSVSQGVFADIYYGAMKLLSGDMYGLDFNQQALYISQTIIGCATQDILKAFPGHWFICVGESGSRKTLANQIIKNTLGLLSNRCFPINMPASREGLYTRLNPDLGGVPKPSVFIEFDEGLTKLAKLWANHKPEPNGALQSLMETLFGAYGNTLELGEITNKDPNKSSKAIANPRIALSINGQGVSLAKALQADSFLNNGFYHRSLVFDFVGDSAVEDIDDYLSDKNTSDLIMHSDHYSYLNVLIEKGFRSNFSLQGRPPTSDYNFKNDYYELLEYLNTYGTPLHISAIIDQHMTRMRQRLRTIAWLHAWGRGGQKMETVDITYAYMIGGLHYQNILNRLKNLPTEDNTDFQLMQYIYNHIKRLGSVKRYYIQQLCHNNNNYKHFKSIQVSQALVELENEGFINSDKSKTQKRLTTYTINCAQKVDLGKNIQ